MVIRLLAVMALSLLTAANVAAQQPTPLFNTPPSNPAPSPAPAPTPLGTPPAAPLGAPTPLPDQPASAPLAQQGRVFCDQTVMAQPVNPASVPERYRQFVGIFSDADWTPQLCAALVVESVTDDGTATITYAFGPIASGDKVASGVLHGTGIVKDGSLLFQNTDGSQYAFKPFYSDLAGRWTNPKGQTYEAIFKRAF
jgi:hypothetical protein